MKKYRYPFTNSLTFALVMQDPRLCRGLLEKIFPDREITMVQVRNSTSQIERTIIADPDAKKVRLDVMFRDDSNVYDIEMQVRDEGNLPKRIRYTHGIMDIEELKPGQFYNSLKPSYVIFICCFDLFKAGKPMYCFQQYDSKNKLPLGDESYTIILNSKAPADTVPPELRPLFDYVNSESITPGDSFIEELDANVNGWNTGERVRRIMTLEQEMMMIREKALAMGRQEGMAEGLEKGMAEGLEKGMAEGLEKGMAEGLEKGMAEGLEKGKAEGLEKGKAELVHTMKLNGMPIEEISKITEMSVDEIKSLLSK